jgi:hypothetical protein
MIAEEQHKKADASAKEAVKQRQLAVKAEERAQANLRKAEVMLQDAIRRRQVEDSIRKKN